MKTELKIKRKVPYAEKIKAPLKWALADNFIGFGKKGSSTEYYREQAKENAIKGNEQRTIVYFVSVNGSPDREDLVLTTTIAQEKLSKGDFLLTDSNSYLGKSTYNKGEKYLRSSLLSMGYFSEQLEACNLISIWGKNRIKLTGMNKELSMQAIERNLICS